MNAHDFGDLLAHRVHRVERGHGLLEDHRDLACAHTAYRFIVGGEQVTSAPEYPTREDTRRRCRQQAHHRERGDALAAPRFADNAQRFAGIDAETHAIDGQDDTLVGVEVDLQPFDVEQALRHGYRMRRGSSASRKPSPM